MPDLFDEVAAQPKKDLFDQIANETQLSSTDEQSFQKWKARVAPNDSGEDYDLRGAFKAGISPDPETGHWPDTFKKPNHPTFSDQSIYANQDAGHWEGNAFVPSHVRQEEIRAAPSILEDVKSGRYSDAGLAALRKISGWTDAVFGSPSDNKAPVSERWNEPSVADQQASDPIVQAVKRTMPGLQMVNPEMIGQLPFFAVPGVAEAYGAGQLAHAPEQYGRLRDEIRNKGLTGETATDVFDTVSQDAMAFLPLAARARALSAARRTAGIRETLKGGEQPSAETSGTQTKTGDSEVPPIVEPGKEGRIRVRDDAQNRVETQPGEAAPQPDQRVVSDQEKLDRIRKALGQEIAVETKPEAVVPEKSEPPEVTTGVANRILKEESDAGKIGEVEPGEGMSWQEMVDRGRTLLNKGADPQGIARRFQRNGRISADDFAVLRAERERLAVETSKAEDAVRTSPNDKIARDAYNQARQTETDWVRNVVQPAKTATSDIFRGMQGESPVDPTTFSGLRKAVLDIHGRDVAPNELRVLSETAERTRRATTEADQSLQRASTAIEKKFGSKSVPKTIDELRDHFANRIKELTPC